MNNAAWRKYAILVLLFAIFLVPVIREIHAPPIYDDKGVMQDNVFVTEHDYKSIWTHPYWGGLTGVYQQENLHRPLFLTIVSLLHDHLVLLRLLVALGHLTACFLLWKCLERWNPNETFVNFAATALFLFNPANVEVTNQVIGLMETWPLVFGVAAFFAAPTRPWLAVALVALNPAWKEIGYVWLGGLGLYFAREKKIKQAIAVFAITAFWLSLRVAISGSLFASEVEPYALLNPMTSMGEWDRFWTRLALLGQNIRLFIVPFRLSSDYSAGTLPVPGYPTQVWTLTGAVCLAVLYAFRKRFNWIAAFSLATLLPTLHLTGPTGAILGERYGYGFRLGLTLFIGLTCLAWKPRLTRDRRVGYAAVSAIIALTFAFCLRNMMRLTIGAARLRSLRKISRTRTGTRSCISTWA